MTATYVQFEPRFDSAAPAGLDGSPALRTALIRTIVPAPCGPALPRERIEAALARVLASATFRHSLRHRAFLQYVVDGVLAGRGKALKEVVIGLDVFGRSLDDFDPRRDSIVRVEARRLRAKLRRYYGTEGRSDAIEIALAIGRYVPTFVDRSAIPFQTPTQTSPVGAPLLMVLPLRTAGDVGMRGWSIGLADQLVARLGAMDPVRVVAPSAATRSQDPALIDDWCRQHGVAFVIDGSIAQAGSRLRCTMFLSRTVDHACLWSQTADFEVMTPNEDDLLFRVQDRVADAVAAAVRRFVAAH